MTRESACKFNTSYNNACMIDITQTAYSMTYKEKYGHVLGHKQCVCQEKKRVDCQTLIFTLSFNTINKR